MHFPIKKAFSGISRGKVVLLGMIVGRAHNYPQRLQQTPINSSRQGVDEVPGLNLCLPGYVQIPVRATFIRLLLTTSMHRHDQAAA